MIPASTARALRRPELPELPEPVDVITRYGQVRIAKIVQSEVDGVPVVEVHAADPESGDPHFRVINPPTRTTTGADDPLAAIAEVLALHGGRKALPRRRTGGGAR